MSAKVLPLLRQRREELATLDSQKFSWQKLTEWHSRTRPLIGQYFPSELDHFDEFIKPELSKVDQAVRAANDNIPMNAKEKLLAYVDALIELVNAPNALG